MQLHPTTAALIPTLTGTGLAVTIHATRVGTVIPFQCDGAVVVDSEGLAVHANRMTETGTTRLGVDAPTVSHRLTAYDGQPGLLLTLVVKNGEVTGARTPHLEDVSLALTLPDGWTWIKLDATERPRLLQGAKWTIRLVLLHVDDAIEPGVQWAIEHRAWLSATPNYIDGLSRPKPFVGLDWTKVDDEGPLTVIDQGGATSGNLVRLGDWGCELLHLPPHEAYDIAWDHVRDVETRQRGYLTLDGKPLEPADVPKGFKLSMGPTERMFATKTANPYLFDEDWIAANAGSILGSIDAAHDGRALQYAAFLAQQFGDQDAMDWLADHAAARRLETPTLKGLPKGQLTRAHAWGLTLQALDWRLNSNEAAWQWSVDAKVVLTEHQRDNGGLCAWLGNKEALVYAPDYLESIGLPRTIQPVTRPEQEMLLAMAEYMAFGHMTAHRVLWFVFKVCRAPGQRGPWTRCGLNGEQLDAGQTNFYSGNALALALNIGIPEAREWVRDFCNGITDPAAQVAWLRARKPSDLRNTFLLIGVLEATLAA